MEHLHWIAGAIELLGLIILRRRKAWGFLLAALGCLVWIAVSLTTGMYGLLLVAIPASYFNARCWWRWRKV